jgi:hypothetical protein
MLGIRLDLTYLTVIKSPKAIIPLRHYSTIPVFIPIMPRHMTITSQCEIKLTGLDTTF